MAGVCHWSPLMVLEDHRAVCFGVVPANSANQLIKAALCKALFLLSIITESEKNRLKYGEHALLQVTLQKLKYKYIYILQVKFVR